MVDLDLLEYLETFVTEERKKRFAEVLKNRTKYLTVAAEDVFQMHNASAIVRSCDVFGIQQLHLIEARFGQRIDKNIAMGAQQWVDVNSYDSSEACIQNLRNQNYKIAATVPSGNSVNLEDFQIREKTALFFGTEKEGLSSTVLEAADFLVQIPMVGFSESLNVSVSAAIILQKLSTELRKGDLPWQLTETEVLEKRFDWAKKSIKNSDQIIERYRAGSASG